MKWDDKANQWRRDLGFKTTKSGAIGQHRFRFGPDEKPAQLAENRLVAFWEALEAFYTANRPGMRCLWEEWSLNIANEIKDGKITVLVPDAPSALFDGLGFTLDETRSIWRDTLAKHFGNIVGFQGDPVAPETIYLGQGVEVPNYAKQGIPSGQTLFQAIDSYVASLNEIHKGLDGRTTQTGKKEGERATRLKRHHQDCPLNTIDGNVIETILRYWSKRPLDAMGKRYAKDTCKNQLILIRAFLRWLHRSGFAWKLPPDFLFPTCKIEWLQEELSAVGNKKRTYTVKEVGICPSIPANERRCACGH